MSLNNLGLGFVFTVRDYATPKLVGLGQSFTKLDGTSAAVSTRLTRNLNRVMLGFGALAAAGTGVIAGLGLAEIAGRFEQGMAGVAAVSGATSEELRDLKQAAIDAGIATEFDPTRAAEGLQVLAQQGLNAKEAVHALLPALDLASASLGTVGIADAAGLASQAMRTFNIAAGDLRGAVDLMVQTSNVSAVSMEHLALGLGVVSRGALATKQSLDTTLLSFGLVKNVIPSVERSATALAVAMERLARPEAQQALRAQGVQVVTASGSFRDFLDIVSDLTKATSRMTDAKRAAYIADVFGAEASAGLLAIMQQLRDGVRNYSGETVHGAEALRFLKLQMEAASGSVKTLDGRVVDTKDGLLELMKQVVASNMPIMTLNGNMIEGAEAVAFLEQAIANTGGAARAFSERLLDTFAGQRLLLTGTIQTIAVRLGEPFARVLKPVVRAVTNALNAMLRAYEAIPDSLKDGVAKLMLGASALFAVVGGALAAKGAVMLLGIGFKFLMASMAGIAATVLPVILVLGLLAAVVAGFVMAFQKDVGSIGTFFRNVFEDIKLWVQALGQLFSDGGFSGALRLELRKAENSGIRTFAIRIYQIVFRIRRFFGGIADGFREAIEASQLVFHRFVSSLQRLGQALGIVGDAADGIAGLHSDKFARAGSVIGDVIGRIVTVLVRLWTISVDVATGIINGFKSMTGFLGPAFGFLGQTFRELGQEIMGLLRSMGFFESGSKDAGTTALSIGQIIGKVLGGLVGVLALALSTAVRFVRGVVMLVRDVGTSLGRLAAGFVTLFENPMEGIKMIMDTFVRVIGSAVNAVLSIFGLHTEDIHGLFDRLWQQVGVKFDAVVARVKNGVLSMARTYMSFIRPVITLLTEIIPAGFGRVVDFLGGLLGRMLDFITGIFDRIRNAIDTMLSYLGRVVARIPSDFRPAFLDRVVDVGRSADERLTQRESEGKDTSVLPFRPPIMAIPAVADAVNSATQGEGITNAISALWARLAQNDGKPEKPVHVVLSVDGQVLAETTQRVQRDNAVRSFK